MMKLGVIIVFHNNEKEIENNSFFQLLYEANNLEFCLVNNGSTDNTLELLNELKYIDLPNVSLVDIKRPKPDNAAVRSGARFIFNEFDLKHVGFINFNTLNKNGNSISTLINSINNYRALIVNHNIKIINEKATKQTLFEKVFSIIEYVEKLKVVKQLAC